MEQSKLTEMKDAIGAGYDAKIAVLQQEEEKLRQEKERLQQEREEAFAVFSRIKKTLCAGEVLHPQPSIPTQPQSITIQPAGGNSLSAAARIKAALDRQTGEFTSHQLWNEASHDGNGPEIPRTAFAPFFALLKRTGQIVVIKEHAGNTPG